MKPNVYITKTHIKNESIDELDFVLYNEFGFDYETSNRLIEIEKNKKRNGWEADGFLVRIDTIINDLKKFQEKGATHIQMNDNCDHHGYDISYFKVEPSTPEEIAEYHEKEKSDMKERSDKLRLKAAELLKESEKILNTVNTLNVI